MGEKEWQKGGMSKDLTGIWGSLVRAVNGLLHALVLLIFSASFPSSFWWDQHFHQTVKVLQEVMSCINFISCITFVAIFHQERFEICNSETVCSCLKPHFFSVVLFKHFS